MSLGIFIYVFARYAVCCSKHWLNLKDTLKLLHCTAVRAVHIWSSLLFNKQHNFFCANYLSNYKIDTCKNWAKILANVISGGLYLLLGHQYIFLSQMRTKRATKRVTLECAIPKTQHKISISRLVKFSWHAAFSRLWWNRTEWCI